MSTLFLSSFRKRRKSVIQALPIFKISSSNISFNLDPQEGPSASFNTTLWRFQFKSCFFTSRCLSLVKVKTYGIIEEEKRTKGTAKNEKI